MAFENIPTPEQMAANWYSLADGSCADCTAAEREKNSYDQWPSDEYGPIPPMLQRWMAPEPIDGVPQIEYHAVMTAQPLGLECVARANSLALQNPEWAKKAGQRGLIKVAGVCHWEAMGLAPDGYMQEVVTELGKSGGGGGIDKRWLWAGGALAAYLLFFRK